MKKNIWLPGAAILKYLTELTMHIWRVKVADMVDKEICWVIFHCGKPFDVKGQKVMNSGSWHWVPRQYSILPISMGVGFEILDPDYKEEKNHSVSVVVWTVQMMLVTQKFYRNIDRGEKRGVFICKTSDFLEH